MRSSDCKLLLLIAAVRNSFPASLLSAVGIEVLCINQQHQALCSAAVCGVDTSQNVPPGVHRVSTTGGWQDVAAGSGAVSSPWSWYCLMANRQQQGKNPAQLNGGEGRWDLQGGVQSGLMSPGLWRDPGVCTLHLNKH